jgi:signal transduction histidine kinase
MVKRLDQDGTFLGHYCFMRDITERRRFEETLRALYQASLEIQEVASLGERLDRILRTAQTVLALDRINILLADEGSQELRAAAALGVDEPLEAIRVPIGPAGGGIAQSYLSQQPIVWADSQTPVPEALRLKPPYDRIRAFRSRAFVLLPLVVQGRSIGVMGADRKVSRRQLDTALLPVLQLFAAQAALAIDRARLHEQLLQAARQLEATVEARTRELQAANERLQEASRHKSAFLATMSHEFRTPLNSILGYSELLQNPVYGPLTEKQARYLGYIHSSGRHLLALIDDLLDLSKIEAGKLELRPAAFHLPEALEAAVNMLRPQAEAKGIEVRLDLDRTLSAFVADPVRFRQILYNLLSNAVKFTPAGGNVTLSARRGQRGERDGSIVADGGSRCAPALADADEFVEIAVRDTGIGIKPDDLAKLFRVFTQLDARPGTRQGVGLGLALTKQLVELHGGTILAASDGEGKGSTFTLRLPFPSPTGRDLPCAASAAVAGEVGKAIRRATGAR